MEDFLKTGNVGSNGMFNEAIERKAWKESEAAN